MAQQPHTIFRDIEGGNLKSVQQCVVADATVLEERAGDYGITPLMYAIYCKKPAIALWLLQHRGQHDPGAASEKSWTALHYGSKYGLLEIVQALVAAGANPAALTRRGSTPLYLASEQGHTDIVALLLQLPAVKTTIDVIDQDQWTALSIASLYGYQSIVQLLLHAGADPTIPAGRISAAYQALDNNHHAVAAIFCQKLSEADRARVLHKLRCLRGAGPATIACLQGRVEQGQAIPQVELPPQQQHQRQNKANKNRRKKIERLRTTAAFSVGVSGGEKDSGLSDELYVELLGYMLPAWADKGPEVC